MSHGVCLKLALDAVQVQPLIALLEELLATSAACSPQKPFSKYFLVMDLVRILGPSNKISRSELLIIQTLITKLALQAFPDERERADVPLPEYPSLGVDGVNVFHIMALYTSGDREKAEIFFSDLKRAGIASKCHLRAVCGRLKSTALHLAAERNNIAMAELVLANDPIQIMTRNADGMTAADLAGSFSNEISKILKVRESEFLRKRQLKGAVKDVVTAASSPLPSDVVISSENPAFARMMEMLKGYSMQQRQAPPIFSSPPRGHVGYRTSLAALGPYQQEEKFHQFARFIRSICQRVPGGDVYGELYLDYFSRLGIRETQSLRDHLLNNLNALKLPVWLKRAIEVEIENPQVETSGYRA
jgi:hypothetical protein